MPASSEGRLPSLVGHDLDGLAHVLAEIGEPADKVRLRSRQLYHWLYHRGVTDLGAMTTLPKGTRVRVLLPQAQAGPCYAPAASGLLRVG